ncbi:MAG: single-stranded DNA-binding protein [Desulfurellaceae bacterium]|nr:single-stranded DNA-binding protein [Desulfurellaceae bacterium]
MSLYRLGSGGRENGCTRRTNRTCRSGTGTPGQGKEESCQRSTYAETCGEYLSKGRQVYIEGRIQTRKVEDKEGKERYFTDINAQKVTFLGGGRAGVAGDEEPSGGADDGGVGPVPPDDDVPF